MRTEFRLLGPVELRIDGKIKTLGSPKKQLFLAMLLAANGTAVSIDQLLDELWWGSPPSSAVANLRNYATALRKALPEPDRARLNCRSGYSLAVEPGATDIHAFERLTSDGRVALDAGDAVAAYGKLELAMARWRGEPLEGLAEGPFLTAFVAHLEQRRTAAQELLFQSECLLGLPGADLVGRLCEWTRRHPLRERGWALLMTALYNDGDIGGALDAFAKARQVISGELGVEPGQELQELHRAILNRELPPPTGRVVVAAGDTVPRELPVGPRHLYGRDGHVDRICAALAQPGRAKGCPATVLVCGPPAAGKSALAIRAAHEVSELFPDGQLYVDLRETPDICLAIRRVLRVLGTPDRSDRAGAAKGLTELAAAYRSGTAGRRLLVVLDNVAQATQVNLLAPAAEGSAVLVTSSSSLSSLRPMLRVTVQPLDEVDALDLLAEGAGPPDGIAETAASRQIANYCAYLPGALVEAAGQLGGSADQDTARLAERLSQVPDALSYLDSIGTSVRASFAYGGQQLRNGSSAARAAAQILMVSTDHPRFAAQDIEPATRLSAIALEQGIRLLVESHLLSVVRPGVYEANHLVRSFAHELLCRSAVPVYKGS